jgi:hypothetical protein
MAALLVLAGAIIHDKVKEKREMKRRKVLDDERRHRQLQAELNRKESKAAFERNYDSEDEKEDETLPRYEDIVGNGEGGSRGNASGGSSGIQNNSDAPPEYGMRPTDTRHHGGVEFSPEICSSVRVNERP